jgi:hypothetical protein
VLQQEGNQNRPMSRAPTMASYGNASVYTEHRETKKFFMGSMDRIFMRDAQRMELEWSREHPFFNFSLLMAITHLPHSYSTSEEKDSTYRVAHCHINWFTLEVPSLRHLAI